MAVSFLRHPFRLLSSYHPSSPIETVPLVAFGEQAADYSENDEGIELARCLKLQYAPLRRL